MVALKFSSQGIEPNTLLEPIPSGNYPVVITSTEMKPTRAGDGSYLEIEMTIQGGEYANRKLFHRLNIHNPNDKAVEIANRTLSAICHVTGILDFQDTQQLHGRPFVAVVSKQPRNDNSSVMTNEVKGYRNLDGTQPGFSGTVAQPQSQPAWSQGPQPLQPQRPQIVPSTPVTPPPIPPTQGNPSWAQVQPQGQPAAPSAIMEAPNPPWMQG